MSKMVLHAFLMVVVLLNLLPPATASDVFFSCTGNVTQSSFTDNLFSAFRQAGIRTFYGIPIGKNIGLAIKRAIYESRSSVIVLSKNHATSTRCLEELVMIMDRRITDAGYLVVPVFYHMDPSDVAEQTGTFGESFAGHEKWFSEKMDMVEEWKQALKEVGNLRGIIILNNGNESQSIERIVREIENKLNHNLQSVAPYYFSWNNFTLLIYVLVSVAVFILRIIFRRNFELAVTNYLQSRTATNHSRRLQHQLMVSERV